MARTSVVIVYSEKSLIVFLAIDIKRKFNQSKGCFICAVLINDGFVGSIQA